MTDLKLKLQTLPLEPGCYLMKNKQGKIIYVGKAKKLKNRVSSYFSGAHNYKTTKLVSQIVDFDYILTHTEKEALILEINLIKKYRPRFNIMFMDDKSYPYLKLTHEKYARLKVVRDKKRDKKSLYFGPYPDASAAHTMRKLMNHLYPLRKCETLPKKVCLYYHLGQCLGPCEFDVKEEDYQSMVDEITRVLKGDDKDLRLRLTKKMNEATESLNFERAAEYRDDLKALDYILDKQAVASESKHNRDVFAYAEKNGVIAIQGLMIRAGKILDRSFALQILVDDADESFISFLAQLYSQNDLPDELLLPYGIDVSLLEEHLELKIHQPQRGNQRKLIELAQTNALKQLEQKAEIFKLKESAQEEALSSLRNKLHLESVETIELIDNSHIQGAYASSAVVVFKDGSPSKKDYRLYNVSNGANDVANMEEAIYRRYLRKIKEQQDLPDCLLVDGGYTQIQAALKSLESLHVSLPVFGLVKDSKHNTSALMDPSGNRIEVSDEPQLYFLLTRMQDEVHRFVITHHKKRRSKGQVASILDDVIGLGPKRKAALRKEFKSLKAMREASDEELLKIVPESVLKGLKDALKSL